MNIQSSKSKKIANIALHVLIWGLWFAAPILFSFNRPKFNEHPPEETYFTFLIWIPMFFSFLLFYLNYFLMIDKLLFNKKILLFLAINIILIFTLSAVSDLLRSLIMERPPMGGEHMPKPPKGFSIGLHNFSFIFMVSISVAIRTTSRWYVTEGQRRNLENVNLKSELNNLKMQLNPHFFFNTLNNIYSLIQSSPSKAQESVHGLAKLMRYHLYETNDEQVSLSGEVEIMENYITLMQLRLSDNVEVEKVFSVENPQARIAPLLFIPLIENSFKHGVSPEEQSSIIIHLEEKSNRLTFETYNTNFPQTYEDDKERGENGIGLENLRKRLLLIYPNKHSFSREYENGKFHVKVVVEL
ncbi:MAG TPA: histidine kinase [Tenuifilaceae bacterium]|nr:histidine kinase [Tenuifilaceae bacterium]